MDSKLMFQSKEALISGRAFNNFQSIESLPEDEESIRMSLAGRLFLNGNTASKHRLADENSYMIHQIPPKHLQESQTLYIETTRNYPYGISPLLRKLVIYEETRQVLSETNHCKLVFACSIGGFLSTPCIKYINKPVQSFTHIPEDLNPLLHMLSTPILKHLINIPLKYISCGYEHIVGLSLDGKIYSWGLGISGCLGHNNLKNYLNPSIIEHIKNKSFEFIECGGYHTMAISDIGEVYS